MKRKITKTGLRRPSKESWQKGPLIKSWQKRFLMTAPFALFQKAL